MEYNTDWPLVKKLKETNDCFVRSLAVAAGITYTEAHQITKELFGREDRKGTKNIPFTVSTPRGKKYLNEKGIEFQRVNAKYTRRDGKSYPLNIRGFYKKYPTGSFIVMVKNHALVIKDGEVKDWPNKIPHIGRPVIAAYEIINKRQLSLFEE